MLTVPRSATMFEKCCSHTELAQTSKGFLEILAAATAVAGGRHLFRYTWLIVNRKNAISQTDEVMAEKTKVFVV